MLDTDLKKLVDEHVEAWNRHDLIKLADFYTDDCVLTDPLTGSLKGKDAVRGFYTNLLHAFPDLVLSVNSAVGSGDILAMEWLTTGTHKGLLPPFKSLLPTGRKVEVAGASFCRLRNGKIERQTNYTDVGSFLSQVGVPISDIWLAA